MLKKPQIRSLSPKIQKNVKKQDPGGLCCFCFSFISTLSQWPGGRVSHQWTGLFELQIFHADTLMSAKRICHNKATKGKKKLWTSRTH